jgi:hypothetical protein
MTEGEFADLVRRFAALLCDPHEGVYSWQITRMEMAKEITTYLLAKMGTPELIQGALSALPDDEKRLEAIATVCHHCGTTDLPCWCMRDD